MLSSEKRPVESIETDENGLPRWVMCHWANQMTERVLLLNHTAQGMPTDVIVFIPNSQRSIVVERSRLHEIPPEPETRRLPSDGLLMVNVVDLPG